MNYLYTVFLNKPGHQTYSFYSGNRLIAHEFSIWPILLFKDWRTSFISKVFKQTRNWSSDCFCQKAPCGRFDILKVIMGGVSLKWAIRHVFTWLLPCATYYPVADGNTQLSSTAHLSPARDASVYGWEIPIATAQQPPGCSCYSLPHWLVLSGYTVLWLACSLLGETAPGDVSRGSFLPGYTGSHRSFIKAWRRWVQSVFFC